MRASRLPCFVASFLLFTSFSGTALAQAGVDFLHEDGRTFGKFLQGPEIRLRVVDPDANVDAFGRDLVFVDVSATLSGDFERFNLEETGFDTGVFESGPIDLVDGAGISGDGVIQTRVDPFTGQDEELLAEYFGPTSNAFDGATVTPFVVVVLDERGDVRLGSLLGWPLRIRVEDPGFDQDPTRLERVEVEVRASSGDVETLELVETSPISGAFEGQIPTTTDLSSGGSSDGIVQGRPNGSVEVTYLNLDTFQEARWTATWVAPHVELVDAAGLPAETYVEFGRVFVRVFDTEFLGDPFFADSVPVDATTLLSGDQETIFLTETGADTRIFTGSLPLGFGGAFPGDGVLQTDSQPGFPDTVRASYQNDLAIDTAEMVGSRTRWLDTQGRPRERFALGETARIRVEDPSVDDPFFFDTAAVDVASLLAGTFQTLFLEETDRSSGIFEGEIRWVEFGAESGEVVTTPGDEVEARHLDLLDGSQDRAAVDRARVTIVDAHGEPTDVVLAEGRLHVRLVQAQDNVDPFRPDVTFATATSDVAGDQQDLTLLETGVDTGVFEGSIRVVFSSSGDPFNGVLDTMPESTFPHFEPDTVRVFRDDAEATARVLGSETTFLDENRQPTDTLIAGRPVRVRVRNAGGDFNVDDSDTTFVDLAEGGADDFESLSLTEIGLHTGIFEGRMPSASSSFATSFNNLYEVFPGSLAAVVQWDNSLTAGSAGKARVMTSRVSFVDDGGVPVDTVLQAARVRLQVIDPDGPFGSLTAQVRSDAAGDEEDVFLQEIRSGLYEGEIETEPRLPGDPIFPFDGRLEFLVDDGNGQAEPETYAATYLDASGRESSDRVDVSPGRLTLDRTTYEIGETLELRLEAPGYSQPGFVSSVVADVSSRDAFDGRSIHLVETAPETGIFLGSLPTREASEPVVTESLGVVSGDLVEAFVPEPFGSDSFRTRADVVGDSLQFVDARGESHEVLRLDEPARIRLISPAFNSSPLGPDTVPVTVLSQLLADEEQVEMVETGNDTGVFEGQISTTFGFFSTPGDGILQAGNPDPFFQPRRERLFVVDPNGLNDGIDAVLGALQFLDHLGQPVDVAVLDQNLRIRVLDASMSSPGFVDTLFVTVQGLHHGDVETVALTETGPDSGVFEGTIPTLQGASAAGVGSENGIFEVDAGESARTGYVNELVAEEVFGEVVFRSARAFFIDAQGRKTDAFQEGTRAFVRVVDGSANSDGFVDQVTVEIRSAALQDVEFSTLVETGPSTGVFEGDVELGGFDGSSSTGVLETDRISFFPPIFDRLRLSYLPANGAPPIDDTARTTGARVEFLESAGGPVATAYTVGSQIFFEIEDLVLWDPMQIDTAFVDLHSVSTGDFESFTLTETAVDSGLFQGSIESTLASTASDDGSLATVEGDVLRLLYQDPFGFELDATVDVDRTLVPDVHADTAETDEDTSVVIPVLANDSDPEGSALSVQSVTQPADGSVVIHPDDTVTFTPNADFHGFTFFFYTATDGDGEAASAQVSVTVSPVNDAPTAVDDSAATSEDTPIVIAVLANDSDVDQDSLSVTGVDAGGNGSAVIHPDDTVTYTPDPDFFGTDQFSYAISDGNGGTAAATVTVTVAPVNDPPVALADAASTREGVAVNVGVLANDSDVENDPLSVTAVSNLVGGTAVIEADDSITFTPTVNFDGSASFTYTLSDGVDTTLGQVTVSVVDALERTVILATESALLGSGTRVSSGDVLVQDAASGTTLATGFELSLASSVTTAAGWDVKADRLDVGTGSTVASDVAYNQLTNAGSITAAQTTPLALPIFSSLPAFETAAPGSQNVTTKPNQTETLAAGAYRDVTVRKGSTLVLSGGDYDLRSLTVERDARVVFAAASTVRVAEKVLLEERTGLEPQSGSGLAGSDLVLHVAGIDGSTGALGETPTAFETGVDAVLHANVYAPNGTVLLRARTTLTGAVIAKHVQTGADGVVDLAAAFSGP